MRKDFNKWNEEKKRIHKKSTKLYYHAREIWWCALGINVGNEEDGTGYSFSRPVLILKGLSAETCVVIPLTTSKQEHRLRPFIGAVDGKDARAILSQIRVIDVKRLVRKIGNLDKKEFEMVKKKAKDML